MHKRVKSEAPTRKSQQTNIIYKRFEKKTAQVYH